MSEQHNNMDSFDYDVVIIGGGMVGASLACALASQSNKKIAVVEAFEFDADSQPSFDDRVIALNYGSRRIWEAMGMWADLEPLIEPINDIHVSDRGYLGATRINHQEENVEALGYVAENRIIGRVLMQRIQRLAHIDWLCPVHIQDLKQNENFVELSLDLAGEQKNVSCKLVVAADGAMSRTRELTGLGVKREDYKQTAVIANVATEYAHKGVAYERFTETGPLAFLPMTRSDDQHRSTIVWTISSAETEQIMSLSDEDFIEQLQQRFGFRLGHILHAGKRNAYALAYVEAEQLVKGRVAIIGNAAHALHPVSGQGYNLALRDAAEIAELIATADDPGHALLLAEYEARRRKDMLRVYTLTDTLVKIFSNKFTPLAHARAAGLIMLDLVPSLRHLMARQSMGLSGRMGKMMRRIPL